MSQPKGSMIAARLCKQALLWEQGRLIDHLRNTQLVGLEDLQVLVLDEADRLLGMGFTDEVLILPPLPPTNSCCLMLS